MQKRTKTKGGTYMHEYDKTYYINEKKTHRDMHMPS